LMKRMIIAIGVAILLTLVLTSGSRLTGARAQKSVNKYRPFGQAEQFVPNRVLVKFRQGIMPDHARNIIAALGARDADELPNIGVHVLDLPEQADERGFAEAMAQRPEVEFAELDRIVRPADVVPNDLWYANWEWHLPKISSPAAWGSTTGSDSIIIAIIDTGVEGTHEDLMGNLVPGRNIYNNNADASDVSGHGTNVAGVAGARGNNGLGVAGVCWTCKIMPIRVTDANSYATWSNLASGLTWAADHAARVANLSFESVSDSSTVKSAAQYFQGKGGVCVGAAGNQSVFNSSPDNPYILTISASDQNDLLWSYSNYGNNVDLAGPAGGYTTARGNTYMYMGGTSMAAPVVAGVAALVLSVNPNLTPAQVQDILKNSADDRGALGWDIYYGWGRVNAARAVNMAAGGNVGDTTPPAVSIASPAAGATVSGYVTVQVSASDNVSVSSVNLSLDGGPQTTVTFSPYTFAWDTTTASNGVHTLTATASDAAGNSTSSSITVTVSNNTVVDTVPPTVTVTSPSGGTTVNGNVSVYANTSDNVGVVRNELYVDGVLAGSSTSVPFSVKWNSRKARAGSHTLQCKAYDAAGNTGLSQLVSVYK
jgi:thermitase